MAERSSRPQSPSLAPLRTIEKAVRQARRRLFVDRLLRNLSFDLVVAATVWAAALLAERLLSLGAAPLLLLAICAVGGVLISFARTFLFGRVEASEAAASVDERLGLRERVSTALFLHGHPVERADPDWERLLVEDGARALAGKRVRQSFPLRVPRVALLALLPAAAAAALWLWVPGLDLLGLESERLAEAAMRQDVEERSRRVEKDLADLEGEARDRELRELEELFKELREAQRRQAEHAAAPGDEPVDGEARKKEELVRLSDLQSRLEERRASQKMADLEKALEKAGAARLKDAELTRKLLEAMKQRDLERAREELGALREEAARLASKPADQLSDEERERLEALASELARLSRLLESKEALSRRLGDASRQLSSKDLPQALDSLKLSEEELARLARDLAEMNLLDEALDKLEDAEDELAELSKHQCPNCGKPRTEKPGEQPGGT